MTAQKAKHVMLKPEHVMNAELMKIKEKTVSLVTVSVMENSVWLENVLNVLLIQIAQILKNARQTMNVYNACKHLIVLKKEPFVLSILARSCQQERTLLQFKTLRF